MFKKMCLLALAVILIVSMMPLAYAAPVMDNIATLGPQYVQKIDNRPDPLTTLQLGYKERALNAKLNGKAVGKVYESARSRYVEMKREGEGVIWTVLGEFKDLQHNAIPEPDRAVNNTTIWIPDFSRAYYMDILFNDAAGANSMRNYYLEQSSNRYTVKGDVTDWVKVPNKAAYYNDNPDANVWLFLEDSVNGWYQAQISAGKAPAEIDAYLSQFDVWDRYDYDLDGNFDEPDGYIDTFQSVHAGEGEEAGGGKLGAKAIWSHSWYARSNLIGTAGPEYNKLGGIQIGSSKFWVGKYTIQPENGGVGVFTHEYAHDMGLPDLYDYYGENGTGFWTLMSSGSWLSDGTVDIGSKPSHMGAWEKFQLGWLNYDIAYAGKTSLHNLGPMEFNTRLAQGLFVVLPKKVVVREVGKPYAGTYFYYSETGDDLDNFMYKSVTLPSGTTTLTAKVNYQIELDWDYAYLVVSENGGTTWTSVTTNLSTSTNPNGQNFGNGITGSSSGWVDLIANLSSYAGKTVLLGFRYWTDGAYSETGLMVDNISLGGSDPDGAEVNAGWTFNGFKVSNGTESGLFSHYYVAEYRTYRGYDSTLQVGPYYFGYLNNRRLVDFVDHFAYQDGLLIHYWDTSQKDNNTGLHPGQGLLLPIDAHFETLRRVDGAPWRNRIQTYDATFTLTPTDGIPNLHHNSVLSPVSSLPAVSAFDDRILHYDAANPLGSVKHPATGTVISIVPPKKSQLADTSLMQIQVSPGN
jgi:immune inhibitor A